MSGSWREREPTHLRLAEGIRRHIQNFDPDLPVLEMHPMSEVISDSLWLKRVSADLIGLFAICGLVLAATGIYGITSVAAVRRKKEMGIRMAFGANRSDVFGLVMSETGWLALIGSVTGCIAGRDGGTRGNQHPHPSPGLASTQSRMLSIPGPLCLALSFSSSLPPPPPMCPPAAPSTRTRQTVLQHQ